MGETNKQVRVDNWGIFFLSRLQAFFNKTDYCDLTLQFEGNVQLKVHRLVMNACTQYFQILEQTCEVVDDVLLMPPDLQTDVILPIVNFMYTGMLEFPMSIFERLYKTAELMNITVLLKILEAQKRPQQPVPKSVVSKVQPTHNLQGKKFVVKADKQQLPATLPGRKLPVWKRKSAPVPVTITPALQYVPETRRTVVDPLAGYDNTPKPTRFEWPEEDLKDFKDFTMLDTSFDNISYTSKPLVTQEEEFRASTSSSGAFDDIKHLPNANVKKTKDYNNTSVDMDELKSYVKEQKIRSNITEEEYEIDNDLDDNDEDPDYKPDMPPINKRKSLVQIQANSSKKIRFSINEKENKNKSDVDHSKIISEVLKKYPHLVKNNKNIRLKILAKNSVEELKKPCIKTQTPKIKLQVKKTLPPVHAKPLVYGGKKQTKGDAKLPLTDEGPWYCNKCSVESEQVEFVLYYLYRKHMTDVHNEKFDSRMCQYCGLRTTKHNMLMYHQFTVHGIKPPAAYTFPKCTQCPYVALTSNLLTRHKLNHTSFDIQCKECKIGFNNDGSLRQHIQITGHTGNTGCINYDCQYCTKHFQTGANLFTHLKTIHRDEAKRDGIVSMDDDDYDDEEEEDDVNKGVKILSNVQLPMHAENNALLEQSQIATSLNLVDIVVLDDNQQYIIRNQEPSNNQEFILPELNNPHEFVQQNRNVLTQSMLGNADIGSTDELVMVLTDHDYNDGNNLTSDNSNIVVLYSHPVEGQENQFITSQGNLMLNSETGMLEIRNTSNATGAETIQTNAVESIEMIQREIDSHVQQDVSGLTHCTQQILEQENHDHVDAGAFTESNETILGHDVTGKNADEYESVQQPDEAMEIDDQPENIAIAQELEPQECQAENVEEIPEESGEALPIIEEGGEEEEATTADVTPEDATNHEETQIEEAPETQQLVVIPEYEPEPMEVDGRIQNTIENEQFVDQYAESIEQNDPNIIENNYSMQVQEIDANPVQEIDELITQNDLVHEESAPEVIEANYAPQISEDAQQGINEHIGQEEGQGELEIHQGNYGEVEINQEIHETNEELAQINETNEELAQINETNEDHQLINEEIQETGHINETDESINETINEELISEEHNEEHQIIEDIQENNEGLDQITEETHATNEELHQINEEIHHGTNEELQEINEDNHETNEELQHQISVEMNEETTHQIGVEINQETQKINEEMQINGVEKKDVGIVDVIVDGGDCVLEATQETEEIIEDAQQDTIVDEEAEDASISQAFESALDTTADSIEDDSVEKIAIDEGKSTEDSVETETPPTKISILDDWSEDTDSQQSSKSGITVNKLINDWDDD